MSTPKVFKDRSKLFVSDPPYGVYPEYSKTPSREELSKQLDSFFKENSISVSQKATGDIINNFISCNIIRKFQKFIQSDSVLEAEILLAHGELRNIMG